MGIGNIVSSIFFEGIERFFKTKSENYQPPVYIPVAFRVPEGDFEFHFDDGGYSSSLYKFSGRHFELQDIFGMDGDEVRVVEHRGILVYHDSDNKSVIYKKGPWEKELRRLYRDFFKEQLSLNL